MGRDVTVYTTDVLDQNKRCDQSGRETNIDGITVRHFGNISNNLAYHYQVFLPLGMRKVVRKRSMDSMLFISTAIETF